MRLDGKIILITGGSRGIGKSIAELFTKEGAKVIITSKNETALKKTAKELGNIFYVKGDITKKIMYLYNNYTNKNKSSSTKELKIA